MKSAFQAVPSNVLIVGANSGIGQALIQQLLDVGATVFGIDIQKESKTSISKKYRYFGATPLDPQKLSEVAQNIGAQTAHIDGLVNLSGTIRKFKPIAALTLEEWDETYDISFKSCFNSCRIFLPLLKGSPKAAIVNMSSGLAFIGQKNYGPYSAAKAAILSFSKTLAAELAPQIRVNAVAPGAVDTDFIYKEDGSTRFNKEAYLKMVPLGTMAKPTEIGSVILFLLSESAAHMTGQCLHVNGGAGMH